MKDKKLIKLLDTSKRNESFALRIELPSKDYGYGYDSKPKLNVNTNTKKGRKKRRKKRKGEMT
jgi:hypothetical protein